MTTAKAVTAALAIALLASACARRVPTELTGARTAYQEAAQDPGITQNAPVALYEAQKSLERATEAWEDEADDERVRSLAYVAARRVEAARAVAAEKEAEDAAAHLHEQREQVVLGAREREIEQLRARQTSRGLTLTLSDVLFETGRATLKPGAARNVRQLAAAVRDEPTREILIEGHTDSTGSDALNQRLSEARAQAVRDALVREGVSPDRIVTRGYGEDYPVASNDTAAGRQQNRRVEVVIVPEGQRAVEAEPPSSVSGFGR